MTKSLMLVLCTFIIACASAPKSDQLLPDLSSPVATDEATDEAAEIPPEENALYQQAIQLSQEKKYAAALEKWEAFTKQFPKSRIFLAVQIKMAEAQYDLKNWNQGNVILQRVIRATIANDPIAARALFRISFGYEAVENDIQALNSLVDAERLSQHLDEETRTIELPARIGLIYARLNERDRAETWYKKADEGIAKFRYKNSEASKLEYPRILYQLGKVNTSTLTTENFQIVLDSLGLSQKYSIRAMEFESASSWAHEARKSLQANYTDLWTFTENPVVPAGLDIQAARRQKQDLVVRWISLILNLVDAAKTELLPGNFMGKAGEAPPEKSERAQFLAFLEDLEHRGKMRAYYAEDLTPLTEESKSQKIKKPLPAISVPSPEHSQPSLAPSPAQPPPIGDPNL